MSNKKPAHARERWTPEQDAALKQKAAAGRTTKQIANDLGRSESAVENRADVTNVSLKPKDK